MAAIVPQWTPGERLAKARKEAGLTQAEMAEKLAVSPGAVAQWETDRVQPRNLRKRLRRWSTITGVSYGWLLAGEYAARDSNPEPTDNGRKRLNPAPMVRMVA